MVTKPSKYGFCAHKQSLRVPKSKVTLMLSTCPFEESYLDTHFTIHIPGNENILKAIKSIKKGQKVMLEGFFVTMMEYFIERAV